MLLLWEKNNREKITELLTNTGQLNNNAFLIEEKGKRSNMEQYSLLLAIEKYDNKMNGKVTIIYCHKCAKEIDNDYLNATFCPFCAAALLSWQPSSGGII